MKNKTLGFTLMELMIVVAILGILSALAYPQYVEYVQKGRRAECRSALLLAAQKMEKFYSNNNTYPAAGAAGRAAANIAANSNDGNPGASCTIEITASVPPTGGAAPQPARFLLTADNTTTYQDRYCRTLTLDELSIKNGTGTDTTRCWR